MNLPFLEYKKLAKQISSCFPEALIEEHAKSTKFVWRSTSRLNGMTFFLMNVFDTTCCNERSLNDCCDWLEDHYGIEMTKQSLDERYNKRSVDFIKVCFNHVLQTLTKSETSQLAPVPFSVIQIVDSTIFKLSGNLASHYVGNGGDGGPSFAKIHFNYDLLNGLIQDVHITDGVAHDNLYKFGKTEQIKPSGLYLRDLGYYDVTYFNNLADNDAFFLSRGKANAVYYQKNEQGKLKRIELEKVLPKPGENVELKEVFVGSGKTKFKARLLFESVPKQVAEQRLEKLKKKAKRHKGKKVSEQSKKMCWFNIYLTNASPTDLPTELIRLIYSLRWQIELIFKIWKSVFEINKVKKMNIHRFECYLYSKLTAILLTVHLQNQLKIVLWNEHQFEVSELKASKGIKKNSLD